MTRCSQYYVLIKNGIPWKTFTVKSECQEFLRQPRGWNIINVWKMPDGKYPLFVAHEINIMDFLND